MRNYLTEAIGTFFLVLTIGLTVTAATPFAPVAIGCALMVMVYMGGHISGAHYNPAVTLAVYLRGKMAAKDVIPYWLAQIAGALLASLVAYWLTAKTFAPLPGENVRAGTALLAEFVFTFALALVVLNVATSLKNEGNSFYGIAIGFTVTAGAFAVGGISGGAFNPAVAIGPTIIHAAFGTGTFDKLWIYLVGPLGGGVLAAIVFRLQNPAAEEVAVVALRALDQKVVGTKPAEGAAPAANPDAPLRDVVR